MTAIINGSSPTVTFSDGTTQATAFTGSASALTSGTLPAARLPAGSVLQVVNATISSQQSTTSSSAVTTTLTANITPSSASSKIYVSISSVVGDGTSGRSAFFLLYKNGSQVFQYESFFNTVSFYPTTITYLDSPATTSATTYALYFRTDGAGTAYVSNGNTPSSITLMEIAG